MRYWTADIVFNASLNGAPNGDTGVAQLAGPGSRECLLDDRLQLKDVDKCEKKISITSN